MALRTSSTLALLLGLAVAAGCNSGSRSSTRQQLGAAATNTSTTGTSPTTSSSTGTPASSTPTGSGLAAEAVAIGATEQRVTSSIVALSFRLAAGANATVSRIDLTSAGSVDETQLGEVRLYADSNGNGQVDQGEPLLATAAKAPADDAAYQLTPATPIALTAGLPRTFLVAVDGSAVAHLDQVRMTGKTIALSIADAAAIVAWDASQASITATGSFPIGQTVTLEVNDTVLISELCTGPGSGATAEEYVELFNATGRQIDLTNYYLTDFGDLTTTGRFYWKLPTGQDFGPSGTNPTDFVVRFPAGTVMQPGQVIVVAVDGVGYQTRFGQSANFCLRNAGASTAVQMLTWDGVVGGVNFVSAPVASSVGFTGPGTTSNGETVILFTWDGTSDLIKDVDILNYGPASPANPATNKTPNQHLVAAALPDVRVDSAFDGDTTASTFQADLEEFQQENLRIMPGANAVSRRVDFNEGTEVKTGGNGLTGHNETSENFNVTFQAFSSANAQPGQVP